MKHNKMTHGDMGLALKKKHAAMVGHDGGAGAIVKIEVGKHDEPKDDGLAPEEHDPKMVEGSPQEEKGESPQEENSESDRDKLLETMIAEHTDHVKPNSLEGKARELMKIKMAERNKKK